jgi:hypothetical protein
MLIHFEKPEIAKKLHYVYKGSWHWEISFQTIFHSRFALLAPNVPGLHHRSETILVFSRLVKDICDLN